MQIDAALKAVNAGSTSRHLGAQEGRTPLAGDAFLSSTYHLVTDNQTGASAGLEQGLPICAKRGWMWNDEHTAATPRRCGGNSCEICSRVNARRRAWAIEDARPTHEFTITLRDDELALLLPPQAWQAIRPVIKRTIEQVRTKTSSPMECAYTVEFASRLHAHVAVRGWTAEQDRALVDALATVNGGLADLTDGQPRPIEDVGAFSSYLVKGMREDPEIHLALNGGAVANHTRRFFSEPVRDAERRAAAQHGATFAADTIEELVGLVPLRGASA